jgi:hypothetical protein
MLSALSIQHNGHCTSFVYKLLPPILSGKQSGSNNQGEAVTSGYHSSEIGNQKLFQRVSTKLAAEHRQTEIQAKPVSSAWMMRSRKCCLFADGRALVRASMPDKAFDGAGIKSLGRKNTLCYPGKGFI